MYPNDMETHLGSLALTPALGHPELLSESVAAMLGKMANADTVGVVEIDPALSDTAAFCERYQIRADQGANCVVLEAKRGERSWLVACVILSSTRADVNGVARRTLDARKVSFAPMEAAVEQSGMEYGAITPIGLPDDWPILIDKAVAESAYVIVGSGIRKSKLAVTGAFLASLKNAVVIDGLAQPRPSA